MFPKIKEYKSTSTPYRAFSKPFQLKDIPFDEEFTTTFSSVRKVKYYDLLKLQDNNYKNATRDALDELAWEFPNYEIFIVRRRAVCLDQCNGIVNAFRLTANRNDKSKKIFVTIQFKYEIPSILKASEEDRLCNLPRKPKKRTLIENESDSDEDEDKDDLPA